MPEEELSRQDLALKNIACAVGFAERGHPEPDARAAARRCDEMAAAVREATKFHIFQASPQDWDGSEAVFRMHVLATVLQHKFGVRYNPAKKSPDVLLEPEDSFIHGILWGGGGTCASLPVLFTAVGRRLGYPLQLASAVAEGRIWHLFCRWEEPGGERFNIEATAPGLGINLDDDYRTGRFQISPSDEKHCGLLNSLSPREELAVFLGDRGHCWLERKHYPNAATTFAWAWGLFPTNKAMKNRFMGTVNRWNEELRKLFPRRGMPRLKVHAPPRCLPESVPREMELDLILLHAREAVLRHWEYEALWWAPLRAGRRPHDTPTLIEVRGVPGQFKIDVHLPPRRGPIPGGFGGMPRFKGQ
jgi:hypothetical protein